MPQIDFVVHSLYTIFVGKRKAAVIYEIRRRTCIGNRRSRKRTRKCKSNRRNRLCAVYQKPAAMESRPVIGKKHPAIQRTVSAIRIRSRVDITPRQLSNKPRQSEARRARKIAASLHRRNAAMLAIRPHPVEFPPRSDIEHDNRRRMSQYRGRQHKHST